MLQIEKITGMKLFFLLAIIGSLFSKGCREDDVEKVRRAWAVEQLKDLLWQEW